ncbi:MAG: phosphatidate cytidylyltransferase [Candidatus Kapaibacteriota bacterium]|jgi:phosphatidate cytidylyltransferase
MKNNELLQRVLVALVGIPIGLYLILSGGIGFVLVIAVLSSIGLWEFFNMMLIKGFKPLVYAALLFNFFATIFSGIMIVDGQFILSLLFLIGNGVAFVVLTLLIQLWDQSKTPIENSFVNLFGLTYVGIFFITLIFIRNFDVVVNFMHNIMPLQIGLELANKEIWGKIVLIHLTAIWICDSAAYFVGKAMGKNKLFERHSPKKTWEGAIGGMVASLIYFVVMLYFFTPQISYFHGIIMGIIVGVFGQLGDLIESQFKRYAGVKDSSHLIPGHGGVLDRFDSILFTSPIMLIYLFFVLFF